jgi:hypothetical protein
VYGISDSAITGNVPVTLTATSRGLPNAAAQTLFIDRHERVLSLNLPTALQENTSATGTVTIPGTLTHERRRGAGELEPGCRQRAAQRRHSCGHDLEHVYDHRSATRVSAPAVAAS